MTSESVSVGLRPPQQERSRRALATILAAAEAVLSEDGLDDFMVSKVAERAGVSIGAIYRRFDGREQLIAAVKDIFLARVETALREALATAEPSLTGQVKAFGLTFSGSFETGSRLFPDLIRASSESAGDRGRLALERMRVMFDEAVEPYRGEVRRLDVTRALIMTRRTLVGACVHRAMLETSMPDGMTWAEFGDGLCGMAITYLLSERLPVPEPEPTRRSTASRNRG